MALYMCASESMIQEQVAPSLKQKHGIEAADIYADGEMIEPEYGWSSGEWIRAQGFLDLAREAGYLFDGA